METILKNKTEADAIAETADALLDNMADDGLQQSNNFEDMESVRDLIREVKTFPHTLDLHTGEEYQFEVAKEQAFDFRADGGRGYPAPVVDT